MKNKLLLLSTLLCLCSACNKTYQCVDQAGIVEGEVKATSSSKAAKLCPSGTTVK